MAKPSEDPQSALSVSTEKNVLSRLGHREIAFWRQLEERLGRWPSWRKIFDKII